MGKLDKKIFKCSNLPILMTTVIKVFNKENGKTEIDRRKSWILLETKSKKKLKTAVGIQ